MTFPRRRNGIVRVPKVWVDAAVEAFFDLQAKGGGSLTIPLPLKPFPYPKIRTALLAVYPQKFVPLFFKVGVISAEGSTGTKSKGGYPVAISVNAQGASAASTIYHELRHVVQYLGDEVVKTKSGTFGRPSRAATASLRARKKAIKSGKVAASSFQAYLSGASEWQPWVGTTADKIVGKILDGGLTKTADVNAAIRKGILSSTFYGGTDPATRGELMTQVYKEIMRQLRGYTDIVPAKHPKLPASAPKAAAPSAPSAPKAKPSVPGVLGVLAGLPTSVRVKIEGAGSQIANEATYAGKDSKGRDKLEIPAADLDAAHLAAEQFIGMAQNGAKLYGGMIYAVRIAHSGKEFEVYVAGAKGATPSAAAPEPGYIYVDKDALKAAKAQAKAYEAAKKKAKAAAKAPKPSAASGPPYTAFGLTLSAATILHKRRLPVGSSAQGVYVAANSQYHIKLKTQIKPGPEVLALLGSGWIRAMKAGDYPKMLSLPELPAFSVPPTPKVSAPKSEAEALALLATIVPAKDIAEHGPITAVEYYFEGVEYGKQSYWLTPTGEKSALEGTALTPKAVTVLKALGWKKLTAAQWLGKAPLPKSNPRRRRRTR